MATQPLEAPHSAPPSILTTNTTTTISTLEPSPVTSRDRSGSTASSHHSHSRPGSLIDRLKPHHNDEKGETTSLLQKVKKKRRKHRAASNSSQNQLGKAGLQAPTTGEELERVSSGKSRRSRYLSNGEDDEGLGAAGEYGDEEDDESDSDGESHLPVTGFAVASNRRQADFHQLFAAVDEEDYLIEGELIWTGKPQKLTSSRLWLCTVQGYFGTRSTIHFGESPMLPRQYFWVDNRCKLCGRNVCTTS
jgi:hypothetical protein